MQRQIWVFDALAIGAVDMTKRSICVSNHADNSVLHSLMRSKQIGTLWKKIRSLQKKAGWLYEIFQSLYF